MAVLVAISIPIFTAQLEKSREATDAANLRAAYAEVMTAGLTEDTANYTKTVTAKQKDLTKWDNTSIETIGDVARPNPAASWTVAYNATTQTVTITPAGGNSGGNAGGETGGTEGSTTGG